MFDQHLSRDAQPSIETLNRHYDSPDADGAPGIDVEPIVRDAEVIEMLNLMCLAVIGVFLEVAELLGQDNPATGSMASLDGRPNTKHSQCFRSSPKQPGSEPPLTNSSFT
jgi:hypothetical protein